MMINDQQYGNGNDAPMLGLVVPDACHFSLVSTELRRSEGSMMNNA